MDQVLGKNPYRALTDQEQNGGNTTTTRCIGPSRKTGGSEMS